jgi:hypothetical protein
MRRPILRKEKVTKRGAFAQDPVDSSPPDALSACSAADPTRFDPQWLKLNFSRLPEIDGMYFCCCHAGSTHAKKSAAPDLFEVSQANAFCGRQNWRSEV